MGRIGTIGDFMVLTGADAPTEAELALIEACKAGEECILSDGKRPDGPDPARTIRADLLRYLILGGSDACRVDSLGVQVMGAYVAGTLDLDFAVAHGQTFMAACRFAEPIKALQTRFQQLNLSGSACPGLWAQDAEVVGSVFLRNGFHATGKVSLSGAKIGGLLDCSNGHFENAGDITLNAERAAVTGNVFLRGGFHATGGVSLSGAKIGGQLDCSNGKFENAGDIALIADSGAVTGNVFLCDSFHATGEVNLMGAKIGGQLDCSNGKFENAGGIALIADAAEVSGSVFLRDDFVATGEVSLAGAKISGQLGCSGGHFASTSGKALTAQRMTVVEGFVWRDVTVTGGRVSLISARVGDLVDNLESWPDGEDRLSLDGFTYDRISGSFTDAPTRLEWLRRGTIWKGEFFPQPHAQLARVLRDMGHDRGARSVLMEQARLVRHHSRRRAMTAADEKSMLHRGWAWLNNLFRLFWDIVERGVVGYGYAPFRSLWALGLLIAVAAGLARLAWDEGSFVPNAADLASPGWSAVAQSAKNPAEVWSGPVGAGKDYEGFNSIVWGAERVVPLVTLGQTAAWTPSRARGFWGWHLWWARWPLSLMGWVVAGFAAAAVTGIIKRE